MLTPEGRASPFGAELQRERQRKSKSENVRAGMQQVHRRKRAVEDSPKGKKGKKARTELEAGPSGGAALEGLQVSSKVIENLGDDEGAALAAGSPECAPHATGAAEGG